MVEETLFEHAGGMEGLHRLENHFYSSVLADPLLQPLFGAGKPDHVDHLTWFTAESFGGPDRFTRELGFGHLIDVHRNLKITEEQRQRFVELYLAALDQASMPADPSTAVIRALGAAASSANVDAPVPQPRSSRCSPVPPALPGSCIRRAERARFR